MTNWISRLVFIRDTEDGKGKLFQDPKTGRLYIKDRVSLIRPLNIN